MSKCKSCGGVPHEWSEMAAGGFDLLACPACPPPRPTNALHAVLGAVLYDVDGELGHWTRASDALLGIAPDLDGLERAVVGWMGHVAASGVAPSRSALLAAMGPDRAVPPMPWFLGHLLNVSPHARYFDAALIQAVRQHHAGRRAA